MFTQSININSPNYTTKYTWKFLQVETTQNNRDEKSVFRLKWSFSDLLPANPQIDM